MIGIVVLNLDHHLYLALKSNDIGRVPGGSRSRRAAGRHVTPLSGPWPEIIAKHLRLHPLTFPSNDFRKQRSLPEAPTGLGNVPQRTRKVFVADSLAFGP